MFVQNIMRLKPRAVPPAMPASEALELLEALEQSAIPVTDEDHRLLGVLEIISLYRAALTRGLNEQTIAGFVKPVPVTVQPEDLIEEVAFRMEGHHLNFLPVTDREGRLIAIVTRDALLDEFRKLFGLGETNSRFTVIMPDVPGQIGRLGAIAAEHGGNITHLATYRAGKDSHVLVMRVSVDHPGVLARALFEAGFKVLDVINFSNGRRVGAVAIS